MALLVLLICWTFAGYIVFRETILKFWWDPIFLDWTMNPIVNSRGPDRWLMPIVLLGRYTALLIAPVKLSIDYGGSVIGSNVEANDPYLSLGFATILACVFAFLIALRKRHGAAAFSLIALGLTYGLVSNIPTIIGTNFGERLMYLPSAFFLILVAMLLAQLPKPALVTVTIVLLALASVRTVTYAARWNDRLSFYESSSRAQPRSVRLLMLISEEHQKRGNYPSAEEALTRGRALEPEYARVWMNSALLAVVQGKYEEAARYEAEVRRIDPRVRNSALDKLLNAWRASSQPTTQPATQP
jgi:tetratricopeptide (TPR) repeat protein